MDSLSEFLWQSVLAELVRSRVLIDMILVWVSNLRRFWCAIVLFLKSFAERCQKGDRARQKRGQAMALCQWNVAQVRRRDTKYDRNTRGWISKNVTVTESIMHVWKSRMKKSYKMSPISMNLWFCHKPWTSNNQFRIMHRHRNHYKWLFQNHYTVTETQRLQWGRLRAFEWAFFGGARSEIIWGGLSIVHSPYSI